MSRIDDEPTLRATAQELIALYRGAESRAARMRLLLGAGRDLAMASATPSAIDDAAEILLTRAAEFSGFPEGCLVLVDEDGRRARIRARLGGRCPAIGEGDALDDPGDLEDAIARGLACAPDRHGAPWVALPFRSAGTRGALFLSASGAWPRFEDEDRETLELLLANFAAIVVIARQREERARLHALLAEREARLDDLVGRLLSAQEDERRRLSIELHDGLAQLTSSAGQHLQAFLECAPPCDPAARGLVDDALRLLRRATAETRTMMADLRPSVLDDFGLGRALEREAEAFRREGGALAFEDALGGVRLAPAVETALFRVAQEALRNVRKHAHAATARMSLAIQGDEAVLRVRDDGGGSVCDAVRDAGARAAGRGERLGLMGMQERMKRVGGRCRIERAPGAGMLVEAQAPLRRTDGAS